MTTPGWRPKVAYFPTRKVQSADSSTWRELAPPPIAACDLHDAIQSLLT
jgi:hypothetical protein